MTNRRAIGTKYEDAAVSFLEQKGYRILARNYRNRRGEIDIIAAEGGDLVFIEVKYRESEQYGRPEEAIDYRKQRRIYQTAVYYMAEQHLPDTTPCRFDVVSILGKRIRVIKNAFEI